MEIKELKIKSDEELVKLLVEWQDKLRDWRFRIGAEQIKNVREIRAAKKTIARIRTLMKERLILKSNQL